MWHSGSGGREIFAAFLLGKLKERRLGRPRHRWEDHIKMNCEDRMGGCVGWPNFGSGMVMNLQDP